ncbi:MauE/DoxX family redox-associated membrane protein [Streptomyces sp. TP-A0874]|uniref:MauE/DoxX family redox-associated membrane protein n=1 Tax=Streptomyces sp. TP-A0874 TaxID=549819 RepID=UPI0008529580|nr:MauE/DoxX family redox-associated membrane protein [Streptomyces sp. TP-A0874]
MLSATTGPAVLALAGLLGWTGAVKLFSTGTARQAPRTALAVLLRSSERATLALRGVGGVELVLAAGLLTLPGTAAPGAALPGVGTAALGAGFLGYLAYGRAAAPESSCGCSANETAVITWRAFVRAGLVLVGGVVAALATVPWWTSIAERPVARLGLLAAAVGVLVVLSADLDRWWLLPLRRTRLRVFGHPLGGTAGRTDVPVAATVQLLESSLAWQAASPVVRSGLLDHWEEDGWRLLQYSGVYEAPVHGGAEESASPGARPVSVVFALDAGASMDTPGDPLVRVGVVDSESGEPIEVRLPTPSVRKELPLVS